MLQIRAWLMTALSTFIVLLVFSFIIAAQERDAQLDEPKRLNEEAVTLYNSGRYKEGIALAEKALAIRGLGITLNNFALLYRAQGNIAQAERLHQQALMILNKSLGSEHPLVAGTLSNLGAVYENKADVVKAIEVLNPALDIREDNLKVIFAGGSENQKQYYLNSITAETSANISFHVIRFPTDAGAARLALTTILRRKGRGLDAMSNQIATLRSHADPEVQTLLSELGNVRSRLANLQFSGRDILSPAVRREISELTAESERLEGEIGRRSVEFRDQTQPITLDVVRQAIPINAALWRSSSFSHAMLLQ
jgi:tetratricopeptide (TPR) repeat protein